MAKAALKKGMTPLMNKYLSKGDIKAIQDLKAELDNKLINVTCMGLYNHGKSSLLNVLIDDFDEQTFKVADKRETAENKSVAHNQFNYIDTPGLNAKENDDKKVMDVVKKSNINLFVHNINTGEFVGKEVDFFNAINKHWQDPQAFIESTIFVLSRKDGVTDEVLEQGRARMQAQIKQYFGCEAIMIAVAAKSYQKGAKENKSMLIKDSGIDELKTCLAKLAKQVSKTLDKTRRARLENKCADLEKHLRHKIEKTRLVIKTHTKECNKLQARLDRLS